MTTKTTIRLIFCAAVFATMALSLRAQQKETKLPDTAFPVAQAQSPKTDNRLQSLEDEVRRLQRDYIDIQKNMMKSGISSTTREELDKVKDIDPLQEKVGKLEQVNEELQLSFRSLQSTAKQAKQESVVTAQIAENASQAWVGSNRVWVLVTAFLVMLMQAGFAMVESGFTRSKNACHTMMLNMLDYGIGMLVFWAIGFALMFGGFGALDSLGIDGERLGQGIGFSIPGSEPGTMSTYTFFGNCGYFLAGDDLFSGGLCTLFLFQMVFAATANTICTGALAERWKLSAFCLCSVAVTGFIYPIFGHWVWGGGWLAKIGYVDFAGSTVVHMVGGIVGLVGIWIVGPRIGKFKADGTSNPIPGHNLPMAYIGTFILAFGWFGFNAGSSLSGTDASIGIIATNTALASASGMVIAALVSKWKFGMPDPSFVCNGMLAGLVAITAPCAFVDPWAAVAIGAVAGVLVVYSVLIIDEKWKLDDPVGAVSVHGTCGAWGGLSVGLFGNGLNGITGLFYGNPKQFLIQSVGVIMCFLFAGLATWVAFKVIEQTVGNRATDEQQLEGLDLAELGTAAYSTDQEDINSDLKRIAPESIEVKG